MDVDRSYITSALIHPEPSIMDLHVYIINGGVVKIVFVFEYPKIWPR